MGRIPGKFIVFAHVGLLALLLASPTAGAKGAITVDGHLPCTITGTQGNDLLHGTSGSDVICGQGGNDIIGGGGGHDTTYGGGGDDTISANGGNDSIYGGAGNDVIDAGKGNDIARGNDGNDDLGGGAGNDSLYGNRGNDTIDGKGGNDTVNGGAGDDDIVGGAGTDRITGGSGSDGFDDDPNDRLIDKEDDQGHQGDHHGEGGGWEGNNGHDGCLTCGDDHAPVAVSSSIAPPTIDTSLQARSVTVNVHATDVGAGVMSMAMLLRSESGESTLIGGATTPTSGTANDGTWTFFILFPRYSERGEWHVELLRILDKSGNGTDIVPHEVDRPTHWHTVEQTGNDDGNAPVIHTLDIGDPVANGDWIDYPVSAHVTDDISGARPNSFTLGARHTIYPKHDATVTFALTAGTDTDGTWTGTIRLHRLTANGSYIVSHLAISDLAGNNSLIQHAALGAGIEKTFSKVGTQDIENPSLVSVELAQTTIDTDQSGDPLRVRVTYTDPGGSGIDVLNLHVHSPTGAMLTTVQRTPRVQVAGTRVDGAEEFDLLLPNNLACGLYTFRLYLADYAGNSIEYSSTTLAGAGQPSTIDVVDNV
jgi:hypothetical protein